MIKRFFLFLLVVATCENLLSQAAAHDSDLVAKYEVTFLVDLNNPNTSRTETMTLLIGNQTSLYKNEHKAVRDSIARSVIKNSIGNAVSSGVNNISLDLSKAPRVHLQHEVLRDEDNIFIYDKVFRYQFVFPAPTKPNWILKPDRKQIGEYMCEKAVADYNGRQITAWYTKAVPVSEGPYVFKGLPGLVIELHDGAHSYDFKLIYLRKEKRLITAQQSAIATSYEKFIKAREESKQNAVNNVQSVLHREMNREEKELVSRNAAKSGNYLD